LTREEIRRDLYYHDANLLQEGNRKKAQRGTGNRTLDNCAGHIQSWLKTLKSDRALLGREAAQAQKAATMFWRERERSAADEKNRRDRL